MKKITYEKEMKKEQRTGNLKSFTQVPENIPEEITETDHARFERVISTALDQETRTRILTPAAVYPKQKNILAVHWHPEFVPMDLISGRIHSMFPNQENSLIIPTQHNEILTYGDFAGVEADCYSMGFNQKVQLLLHFAKDRVKDAHVFRGMLEHTFKYRSSQLFEFIGTIICPIEERLEDAAAKTGANADLIRFVQIYVKKIHLLMEEKNDEMPVHMIKNKLLRNFFDTLREDYGDALIERAQTFLTAVKKIVKAHFPFKYFYRTEEVIEEARSLGGGIVIPHPEQFWPILLARYDVDGYEVWNPQSRRYTEFLISVLNRTNSTIRDKERKLLIFMGDDTHMGEKVKAPSEQKPEKAMREIGLQPAWEDMNIRKTLIKANCSREQVIKEYRERLSG